MTNPALWSAGGTWSQRKLPFFGNANDSRNRVQIKLKENRIQTREGVRAGQPLTFLVHSFELL